MLFEQYAPVRFYRDLIMMQLYVVKWMFYQRDGIVCSICEQEKVLNLTRGFIVRNMFMFTS